MVLVPATYLVCLVLTMIWGCGSDVQVLKAQGVVEEVEASQATHIAHEAELYAAEKYGLDGDWAERATLIIAGQEAVNQACGRPVESCTISIWRVVVSDQFDWKMPYAHELGHIMAFRALKDWDYDHVLLKDYFENFVGAVGTGI